MAKEKGTKYSLNYFFIITKIIQNLRKIVYFKPERFINKGLIDKVMKICDISKENYPSERFSMLGPDVLSDSFMMKNFRKGSYLMFVYSAS